MHQKVIDNFIPAPMIANLKDLFGVSISLKTKYHSRNLPDRHKHQAGFLFYK